MTFLSKRNYLQYLSMSQWQYNLSWCSTNNNCINWHFGGFLLPVRSIHPPPFPPHPLPPGPHAPPHCLTQRVICLSRPGLIALGIRMTGKHAHPNGRWEAEFSRQVALLGSVEDEFSRQMVFLGLAEGERSILEDRWLSWVQWRMKCLI